MRNGKISSVTQTNSAHLKKRRKPKEKVVVESSEDPNLEMALALSASLAQGSKLVNTEDWKINVVDNNECQSTTEIVTQGCNGNVISKQDDICKVPDVIMPNASCWWKKPQSPISQKQSVNKRTQNRKHGKTALEVTTDIVRNRQISEQVAHILTESTR